MNSLFFFYVLCTLYKNVLYQTHSPLLLLYQQPYKMDESRSISSKSFIEESQIVITYDEFNMLINTFDQEEQAKELQELVKNHAEIDHYPDKGYFAGSGTIMKELKYLIDKYTHGDQNQITTLNSELDIQPNQEQLTLYKRVIHGQSINITDLNYNSIVERIIILTVLPSNRFDMVYSDKQRETIKQEGSFNQIIVTNKCIQKKKMFIIFEYIHQILELQSLIDEELPLSKFKPILSHFNSQGNNMSKSEIQNGKNIFFFRRRTKKDWDIFIDKINNFSGPQDVLVMKFRHFSQVLEKRAFFNTHIRIVMDEDEIRFNNDEISQLKIYQNVKEESQSLEELVIKIIKNGSRPYRYKEKLVDPITCFNILLLEHKKVDSLYLLEGDQQKQYVVFTFYKKMMEITIDPQTKKVVSLTPRDQFLQIGNKYYIEAIQKIKKHAVINQLPFYILYQDASDVVKVDISQLEFNQSENILKLYVYQYLLDKIKFKIVAEEGQNQQDIINKYQKPFSIIFDKESKMFSKMSKIKSEAIIKKVKIKDGAREKGKMETQTNFARRFIKKCIDQLTSQ